MKWLRENWTKVILVALLVLAGFLWNNSRVNKKESKAKIEAFETDIRSSRDSIINLENALAFEQMKADSIDGENVRLGGMIAVQEEVIEQKDRELRDERNRIKDLPATEQMNLLAENLSKEMGTDVELNLRTVDGDTLVDLEIEHVKTVNTVFVDRDFGRIQLTEHKHLLEIKQDQIENLGDLILSKNRSIGMLNNTVEEKDDIIVNQEEIIKENKKMSRRAKLKWFGIGFGTGLLTGIGITLI
jgi:hypothetical protein